MSLINEALKKAQKMRADQSPATAPASGAAAVPAVTARGRALPALSVVLALLVGSGLVSVSIAATLLLLGSDPQPAAPVTRITDAPAAAAPALSEVPPIAISLAPVPTPLPAPAAGSGAAEPSAHVPPAATTSAPGNPVVATPAMSTATAASPTPDPTPAPPAPVTVPAARPDPRVLDFIDRLRVSGIRASASDPRVSMNDRVFRLNEEVDRALGLKIVGIESSGLTFVDAAGVVYKKTF